MRDAAGNDLNRMRWCVDHIIVAQLTAKLRSADDLSMCSICRVSHAAVIEKSPGSASCTAFSDRLRRILMIFIFLRWGCANQCMLGCRADAHG